MKPRDNNLWAGLENLARMAFAFLTAWWKRRRDPPLTQLHWVMYTRAGCHLCETAWQELQQRQHRHGFRLTAVDIAADPRLEELYGEQIPVVLVNGKVRFRGRINRVLLTRLLAAEVRKAARA